MQAAALPLLLLLFATLCAYGQRRGPDQAPALGAAIPEVSARSPDGKTTVDFTKPERLTVLIFGSHT